MSIGISEEHVELAATLRKWASSLGGTELTRTAEEDAHATFAEAWSAAQEMGITTIALPEAAGGGGGTVLDVAVALEACAHELVPGALLGPAVASLLLGSSEHAATLAEGAVVGLALGDVVWDAPQATHVLLATPGDAWVLAPREAVELDLAAPGLDLTRRFGTVRLVDDAAAVAVPGLTTARVRRAAVTLAAAEASGLARWCLATAVDYAKVREQFGRKIGSFQAIKHLCAEMLEHAETVTSLAWDVANAADAGDDAQWTYASDVAGALAFDAALEVAKSCIQVLGGIGFTFEHDAHFYYRRASALRGLLGSSDAAALRLASRAAAGERRRLDVDLEGRDEALRPEARDTAARIAALPDAERRAALVDSGYLTPHWPTPYGLGADAVRQLVIDQELTRAGVERPDLVIAGWALPTILEHGTEEQRERFVRPSLLGELVWCQLFSEPGAGSDLASLRTRAERVEGGWRLSGQKVWTSVAHRADWGICLARTDPEAPQHRGITYFLVDMRNSEGIEVRPLREMTGEALFNEVFLDDVFVPDGCVVAEPGDGWRLARTTLANERVAMASSRLGTSTERAVELAAAGLGEADLVKVGRAVALSTVCSLLGVRTVMRSLAGRGPGPESSVAKLLGVRSRQEGSELVVALQQDRLVVPDEQLRADLWEMLSTRCLSIAGGTTQVLRNVAGERILGLPR
ncbi:acyl-CoA dehydrogenase [Nocardioides sp. zg-DK7169]|uniref:acyl-CoA dehydrogenase n=1 Tax=Nocardioides sp. zg-DK7169 TaxID=2736600 RepID=UPI001552EEEC|nr:acyl-CoA dehydrogenase [Nocardioides sp. zg-DK7169]NPC96240.1 acyl-CoA dehydrogenase [Nocardioides sp. zg-DK7169]